MASTGARADWTYGYVSDVEYTSEFFRELAPGLLSFAALLKGVPAPSQDQPFAYMELGCGQGLSANVLAATNPHARFYANDFNPTHVLNARTFARDAGIDNLTFLEKSFAELAELDLPDFDFITLHGVYSWVSEENRALIVDFIRRKLRSGGIIYVSYNCLPGWTAVAPLRRLMVEYSDHLSGATPDRISKAVEFAAKLEQAGAKYFAANAIVPSQLDQIRKLDPQYLAHEYFNRDWALLYHSDVVEDMAKAKLSYVGSADMVEQFDEFMVPPMARTIVADIVEPALRETVKDFINNQQFRRDVFARGTGRMSGPVKAEAWDAKRVALIRRRDDCVLKVKVPVGEADLSENLYAPILDSLAEGPRTIGELMAEREIKGLNTKLVLNVIGIMVSLAYVSPALPEAGEEERRARSDTFNSAVLARTLKGSNTPCLASPVLGTGIEADIFDHLFLAALKNEESNPEIFAWNGLCQRNERLVKNGKALVSPEENLAELRARAESFRVNRLPILKQLGIA
jgi:SAM-dependent methyltransferase